MSLNVEWKHGDLCVWYGGDYYFIGDSPAKKCSAVIQSIDGFVGCAFYEDISKPTSKEELARLKALENGRAYYNLVVSVCMGWDGREHLDWDDLSDSDKGIHIELAEKIGFKASGNE